MRRTCCTEGKAGAKFSRSELTLQFSLVYISFRNYFYTTGSNPPGNPDLYIFKKLSILTKYQHLLTYSIVYY